MESMRRDATSGNRGQVLAGIVFEQTPSTSLKAKVECCYLGI